MILSAHPSVFRRQTSGSLLSWACCGLLVLTATCLGQQKTCDRANRLESQGHFAEASQVLTTALGQDNLSAREREQVEFELSASGVLNSISLTPNPPCSPNLRNQSKTLPGRNTSNGSKKLASTAAR